MVVPGSMVSVLPDVTNTWSIRAYLYAANCGSGSAIRSTNQHGGSVTLETCLKDQVCAYPGLRVDVATNVDHVLEGLCVGRRHGQLRVAMGTAAAGFPHQHHTALWPARVSGLPGFRGSRGSPQEAHREERCAQHAAHPKRLNARLCSPCAPATRRGPRAEQGPSRPLASWTLVEGALPPARYEWRWGDRPLRVRQGRAGVMSAEKDR